jgi:hypothetical protein
LLTVPTSTYAQCNTGPSAKGFNAIYGNCGVSTSTQAAFTLVDATQYTTSGDVCQRINAIMAAYSGSAPGGVVVDARGGQSRFFLTTLFDQSLAAHNPTSIKRSSPTIWDDIDNF